MRVQTIFRAGNSAVVAIPKDVAQEVGLRSGQKVVVSKLAQGQGVLVQKVSQKPKKESKVSTEFKKWLDTVLEEDEEILNELALR